MKTVRLHFSKLFECKYISHLDLMRTFSRAFKQSGFPLWYTEGFNPHLYMVFSLPLSLGYESTCETVDIRITDESFEYDRFYELNNYLPYGIEVFNVSECLYKLTDIAYSRYIIEIADNNLNCDTIAECISNLLDSNEILIEKKDKKGRMQTKNVRLLVHSYKCSCTEDTVIIDMVCASSQASTLNPGLIIGKAFSDSGIDPEHCLIKRTQILTSDMKIFE